MKVTIIKGPMFEQRKELAQELLYKVIRDEVKKEQKTA